jgi:hypothetical protein
MAIKVRLEMKNSPTKVEAWSERFADSTPLRALIQGIPHIGGPLDTLLSGSGQKFKMERIEYFLNVLSERMDALDAVQEMKELGTCPELYDLMRATLEQVSKNRSQVKLESFANIVSKQIIIAADWEKSDMALRLIADLTDLHLSILTVAANAPYSGGPFGELRIVELATESPILKPPEQTFTTAKLSELVQGATREELEICCSELIAKGLLRDDGISRYGGVSMSFFAATRNAYWLLDWIKSPT